MTEDFVAKGWDALIGDLYLAALDPEAAARVAPALARIIGGETASLWMLDPLTGALANRPLTNLAPEGLALYAAHWHRHDPWTLPLARQPTQRVARGSEFIADEDLARSGFHAEFGKATGAFHVAGSVLPFAGITAVGAVAVQRSRERGAFSDAEVALLGRLLPHVRRSLQLEARLRADRMPLLAGAAALDAIASAVVVLDGQGTVVHANLAAETLDRGGGGGLALRRRGEDGRIAAGSPDDTAWLRQSAAAAAGGEAGGTRLLAGADGTAWAAIVTPLPRRLAGQAEAGWVPGMALLILRPMAAPTRMREQLRLCIGLGLTRAEAEAACLLGAGRSPEEIGRDRDVRLSTVRTLLNRAMQKLGARDLRDLVRMVSLLAT